MDGCKKKKQTMVIWDLSCKSESTFLPAYLDDARTEELGKIQTFIWLIH